MLYSGHLCDQVSYILCSPDTPDEDAMVYRAGLPVKLPPGMILDDMAPQEPLPPILKKKLDMPLAEHDRSQDELHELHLLTLMMKMMLMKLLFPHL